MLGFGGSLTLLFETGGFFFSLNPLAFGLGLYCSDSFLFNAERQSSSLFFGFPFLLSEQSGVCLACDASGFLGFETLFLKSELLVFSFDLFLISLKLDFEEPSSLFFFHLVGTVINLVLGHNL